MNYFMMLPTALIRWSVFHVYEVRMGKMARISHHDTRYLDWRSS